MVGEKAWEHGMVATAVRYFDRGAADQAEAWIQADLPVAQVSVQACASREPPERV